MGKQRSIALCSLSFSLAWNKAPFPCPLEPAEELYLHVSSHPPLQPGSSKACRGKAATRDHSIADWSDLLHIWGQDFRTQNTWCGCLSSCVDPGSLPDAGTVSYCRAGGVSVDGAKGMQSSCDDPGVWWCSEDCPFPFLPYPSEVWVRKNTSW